MRCVQRECHLYPANSRRRRGVPKRSTGRVLVLTKTVSCTYRTAKGLDGRQDWDCMDSVSSCFPTHTHTHVAIIEPTNQAAFYISLRPFETSVINICI